MPLKILFFASLRDAAGTGEKLMEVEPGSTVTALWSQLSAEMQLPREKVLCAVNQEYVDAEYVITEDDHEIAFFPPVTGG